MPWGAAGRKSDSGGGDEAVLLEQFQPARRVACNRNGFEVGGRVPVVRLSADQQEDCFEDFVSACDDGALMPSSQAKCLEPGLEGASRPTGRVRELAWVETEADRNNLQGCPCGLFTVRSPRGNPGYESVQRVMLGIGVQPPYRCSTSTVSTHSYSLSSSGVARAASRNEF